MSEENMKSGMALVYENWASKYPKTKMTTAGKFELVMALLDPPIDEETGIKPEPMITKEQALELLNAPLTLHE